MPTKSIASILIIAIVVVIAVRIVLVVIGIGRTIRVRIGIVIMASIICILWLVYCLIGVLGYVRVGVVIHIVIVLIEYVLPLTMRVVLMMVVVVMDLHIEVASSVFRFRLVATISHYVFSNNYYCYLVIPSSISDQQKRYHLLLHIPSLFMGNTLR